MKAARALYLSWPTAKRGTSEQRRTRHIDVQREYAGVRRLTGEEAQDGEVGNVQRVLVAACRPEREARRIFEQRALRHDLDAATAVDLRHAVLCVHRGV